jgi:hypothetical protein
MCDDALNTIIKSLADIELKLSAIRAQLAALHAPAIETLAPIGVTP